MNLIRAAGLASVPATADIRANEAAWKRLVGEAADFLRAGGALSLADWRDLEDAERAAFVDASGIVQAERAAQVGVAAQGLFGAAAVLSKADGGDAASALALRQAVASVVEAVKGEAPVPVEAP